VEVPFTKMTSNIVTILKSEGFIQDYEMVSEDKDKTILISLKYTGKRRTPIITTLKRVSKPGVRVYIGAKNLPRILGNLGIAIISTSQGLMTDAEARKMKVGGEILCYIW
jgi:small subunit ribosomal protein S8